MGNTKSCSELCMDLKSHLILHGYIVSNKKRIDKFILGRGIPW